MVVVVPTSHCYSPALLLLLTYTIHVYGSGHKTNKDLWSYVNFECNLSCPYGFETDVEGVRMCKCHDPCMNIYCLGGTSCVVKIPDSCPWESCKPKPLCKDMGRKNKVKEPQLSKMMEWVNWYYNDVAARDQSDPSAEEDVCSLPLPVGSLTCSQKQKRWFFDVKTETCKKFRGCVAPGNNFERKWLCKMQCLKKKKDVGGKSKVGELQRSGWANWYHNDVASRDLTGLKEKADACSLSPVQSSTNCHQKGKRWFFDVKTGTCTKFRGCGAPGNNFRRKWHCKKRCIKKRKGRKSKRRS